MGPDLLDELDARCPDCGAALRTAAPWCTQCYRDLRLPDAVPAEVAPVPAEVPAVPAAVPSPVGPRVAVPARHDGPGPTDGTAAPTWPCTSCGADNALDADACSGCGLAFLSDLRAGEQPLLVLPVVGDVAALGRAQRLLFAALVVAALMAVAVLAGLLLP